MLTLALLAGIRRESRKSDFWLQLIGRTGITPETTWRPLQAEALELEKILAKSVVTLKTKPVALEKGARFAF
jgi:hypothetical protein